MKKHVIALQKLQKEIVFLFLTSITLVILIWFLIVTYFFGECTIAQAIVWSVMMLILLYFSFTSLLEGYKEYKKLNQIVKHYYGPNKEVNERAKFDDIINCYIVDTEIESIKSKKHLPGFDNLYKYMSNQISLSDISYERAEQIAKVIKKDSL